MKFNKNYCIQLEIENKKLRKALEAANEQLDLWREGFPNYADSEEVACMIDNALKKDNVPENFDKSILLVDEIYSLLTFITQRYPPIMRSLNHGETAYDCSLCRQNVNSIYHIEKCIVGKTLNILTNF